MASHPSGIPHLDVDETHRRERAGDITLIDVRMAQEWQDTGLPQGSHRATLQDPQFLSLVHEAVKGDRDRAIAFTCAVGGRSLQAAVIAHQNGYENVFNVDGGFAAWHAAALPTDEA
ncbi:MAG: rhodanese-like domain-containing protein [Pseudomonadota bacterium]